MTQFILPVLVCAVYAMVVGMLWYSKMLFGSIWMKSAGLTPEKMEVGKKKMAPYMALAVVGSLVTAAVFAHLIPKFTTGAVGGLLFGVVVWLGFTLISQLDSVLWDGKSWTYFSINALHSLVRLAGMGAIIGAWLT